MSRNLHVGAPHKRGLEVPHLNCLSEVWHSPNAREKPPSDPRGVIRIARKPCLKNSVLRDGAVEQKRQAKEHNERGREPRSEWGSAGHYDQNPGGVTRMADEGIGPVVTTCWPRSVWMRMTEEKNRFTRIAQSARAYPAATVNRQTPCSQPGTSSLQWKRPRSSPATIQCMHRTSDNTLNASGGFLPPGRLRSPKSPGWRPCRLLRTMRRPPRPRTRLPLGKPRLASATLQFQRKRSGATHDPRSTAVGACTCESAGFPAPDDVIDIRS